MSPEEFKNHHGITFLKTAIAFMIICSFGCNKQKNESFENEKNARFVFVDSVKIDIPYGFGVVTAEAKDSKVLLYSYIDEHFFLFDYSKDQELTEYYFRGEGPKEYSGILQYAGMYQDQPFFIDHQKILFYQPKENELNPVRWQYPFPVKFGGLPSLSAEFLGHKQLFVNNLVPSMFVKKSADVKPTLDTIPIWKYLEFDDLTERFEVKGEGFLNEKSGHYSDKRLFSYQFKSWIRDGKIYSIGGYINELLVYENLESKYPSNKIEITIPKFNQSEGFSEPLTVENFRKINELESQASRIVHTYVMEDKQLFLTYSLGEKISDSEKETQYGYWFDYGKIKGKKVALPKENEENSLWYNRIAYLGNNRFLFVQSNKNVERDFHKGLIYQLEHVLDEDIQSR